MKEKEDKDIKATTTTKTTSEGFRRMPAEVSNNKKRIIGYKYKTNNDGGYIEHWKL